MNNTAGNGIIIIVSGPSASGKGTVVSRALEKADDARVDVRLSVSMTTRGIGKNEVDGETYYYVSKEAFEENIARGNLAEYNSYAEEYYGTPKDKLESWLEAGNSVILEIDVNGGAAFLGVLHHPLDRRGIRADDGDNMADSHHIAVTDID